MRFCQPDIMAHEQFYQWQQYLNTSGLEEANSNPSGATKREMDHTDFLANEAEASMGPAA